MTGYIHISPPPTLTHSLAILPFYDLRCTVLKPYINRTLVVGTVNGYRLHNRYIVLRISSEAKDFSCLHSLQTGSGAHPTPISWAPEMFPRWQRIRWGEESDHSPPSDVMRFRINGVTPPLTFMSWWRAVTTLTRKGKSKGKVHPRTGHEGPEGE
jgi:hypothetical protein